MSAGDVDPPERGDDAESAHASASASGARGGEQISPELAELALANGVSTGYYDQAGNWHAVGRSTVVAVLAAMGVEAADDAVVSASLRDCRLRSWRRMLPPVYVHEQGDQGTVWVHVPHGSAVQLELELEATGAHHEALRLRQVEDLSAPQEVMSPEGSQLIGQASFRIPADLPLGWHTLRAHGEGRSATCPLVVTPPHLQPPPAGWGLMAQLYSLRSQRSWGLGDLEDLTRLCEWAAAKGADFVLVNPLHAGGVVPPLEASPYLPATRRFVDPIYLAVDALPEYGSLAASARARVDEQAIGVRAMNRTADLLDRDAVWAAKRSALELIFEESVTDTQSESFEHYRRREGRGLRDFAAWCALSEEYGPRWQKWPDELRDPHSAATAVAVDHLSDRVAFFEWLQWRADHQLQEVQDRALAAGMRIGVVHDLAVGVHGDGLETWRLADVLAADVTVGAPPDMYNQLGQNWAQPPWRPDQLAEEAFLPYRNMLRSVLRHAGGIRVDHVLGLFRQWWIPEGRAATEGTYVAMDHRALVGILALEAHRVGAVVIGEDLGTVEDWIRDYLALRGVLGTGVLWFKRDMAGAVEPPEDWRPAELASVTVHDLPPTAAYLRGDHVVLRQELGLLTESMANAYREHQHEVGQWLDLLADRSLLDPADAEAVRGYLAGLGQETEVPAVSDDVWERVVVSLHKALALSPALLRGVSLPDVCGDRRTQNQPGTHREYPNWRIPLTDALSEPVSLADLAEGQFSAALARLAGEND